MCKNAIIERYTSARQGIVILLRSRVQGKTVETGENLEKNREKLEKTLLWRWLICILQEGQIFR